MNSDFLTQDELNELLKGLSDTLSEHDQEAIKEISNLIIDSSAAALGIVIGREVKVTLVETSQKTLKDLLSSFDETIVAVQIEFSDGLKGEFLILFPQSLGARIADMMMGGSGEPENFELDEVRLSAITETMNQMMGSSTTSLSEQTKKKVSISKLKVDLVKKDEEPVLNFNLAQVLAYVAYEIDLENSHKSKILLIAPALFFKDIYKIIHPAQEPEKEKEQKREEEKVKVQPVQFQEFDQSQRAAVSTPSEFSDKLELLLDVPLKVVVELGRAKMTLKQVLEMNIGSLIELDKLTGEPVDILVNGRLIAKGEVVVVDENFGVRITEIVTPKQRIYSIRETNGL